MKPPEVAARTYASETAGSAALFVATVEEHPAFTSRAAKRAAGAADIAPSRRVGIVAVVLS